MNKLAHPIVILALGLVLGVGTTLAVLAQASARMVAQAAARPKAVAPTGQPEKPWDFWTVEMENLATDLKDERARLQQREESLQQREARLKVETLELEKMRKHIEEMQALIDQRLVDVSSGEAANLKKLAQTFSTLTPKAAVTIFREMDDATLVKLLSLMKPEVVGAIFEEISKQSTSDPALAKRVATLSERLRLVKVSKPAAN